MNKWFETGWDGVKEREKTQSKFEAGELKSAVQKYIRRGEIEKAVRAADEMVRIGGAAPLLKRIPSIVGEDCGWRKLWAVQLCYDLRWGDKPLTPEQHIRLLAAVAILARGPKDKDGAHMNDVLRYHKPDKIRPMSDEEMLTFFKAAIESKDEFTAGRMIVRWSDATKGKMHKSPFWPILLEAGQARGHDLRNWAGVLEAVKRRLAQGFFFSHDADGLVLNCVQAVCREGAWDDEFPDELKDQVTQWFKNPKPLVMDWYCLDMHTVIGKIAAKSLCTKKGWDYRRLDELWFCLESAKLNGHVPSQYWDDWAWNFQHKFQMSIEEARAEWEAKKVDVQGLVEWLMDKRGKR
jgi:hypothetical protein